MHDGFCVAWVQLKSPISVMKVAFDEALCSIANEMMERVGL